MIYNRIRPIFGFSSIFEIDPTTRYLPILLHYVSSSSIIYGGSSSIAIDSSATYITLEFWGTIMCSIKLCKYTVLIILNYKEQLILYRCIIKCYGLHGALNLAECR